MVYQISSGQGLSECELEVAKFWHFCKKTIYRNAILKFFGVRQSENFSVRNFADK